jgi:hypothetical protein
VKNGNKWDFPTLVIAPVVFDLASLIDELIEWYEFETGRCAIFVATFSEQFFRILGHYKKLLTSCLAKKRARGSNSPFFLKLEETAFYVLAQERPGKARVAFNRLADVSEPGFVGHLHVIWRQLFRFAVEQHSGLLAACLRRTESLARRPSILVRPLRIIS